MDTWGMAGREMYWRPVLNFYVVPAPSRGCLELLARRTSCEEATEVW